MRDGCFVKTVTLSETNVNELTKLMVNREITFERMENPYIEDHETALEVKNLCYRNLLKEISFTLKKGEILGVAGLVGSGRTEMAKCIVGAYKKNEGKITCKNGAVVLKDNNIASAIENGITYLSEDRKEEGLILAHSVSDNITYPNLKYFGRIVLNIGAMSVFSLKYIQRLKIKVADHMQPVKYLSGGNQQKVVIAKWIANHASVYIFDEPTRGIDVGARDEIYDAMMDIVANGASIIMISSDLPEILKMSNRIMIMKEGEVAAIIDNEESLTQKKVLDYALQGVSL
jgi:ribose transport system ATP-binding protein